MSQNTLLMTQAVNWQRARQVNATDSSFPTRLITATEPANSLGTNAAQATSGSVFDLANPSKSDVSQNGLILKPYGSGSNTNTFSLRVIGWSYLIEGDPNTAIWDPTILVELQATISSTPIGLAGKLVKATDLFATSIAVTTGNANVSMEQVSPGSGIAAHAVVDLKGFQKVEFVFTTGSSATDCNLLWRLF